MPRGQYLPADPAERNIVPYEARIASDNLRRAELGNSLSAAIDAGEVTVHYQPIVSLKRNRAVAVEAFARWVHPTFGSIPPGEFIPLAEERGCISRLTDLVLGRAAAALKDFRNLPGSSNLALAINISPQEFADVDLTRRIATVLDQHRLPGRALHLEITESVVAFDQDNISAELRRLRRYGLRVALTNAGTSGSTAKLLKTLPVDILKIDRSYTAMLVDQPGDGSFVEAIVALSETFRIPVVAEGIEDIPQLLRIRELGIEMAQGYLWRPPAPADQLDLYLRRQSQRNRDRLRKHLQRKRSVIPT